MNPGIFYLYEYKNNQKMRNVGFLKVIRHYQTCTVQIQARGIPVGRQDTLKVSAFYVENETAHAEVVSEISCNTHAVSAKLNIPESRFPDKRPLNNIHGFLLQLPDGNVLATAMPGITLDTHNIRYPEKQEKSLQADSVQLEAESLDLCTLPSPEENTAPEEDASLEKNAPPAKSAAPEESASPIEDTSSKENIPPAEKIRKILRSEMTCLPRKYWSLANNSFLLHGYHNYNHLLLVEKDGHYWLGIPGIYDPREARAAELFGFPQFTDSYNKNLELSEDECNDCGIFGYWCRYLK